jgi:hypothetical protein
MAQTSVAFQMRTAVVAVPAGDRGTTPTASAPSLTIRGLALVRDDEIPKGGAGTSRAVGPSKVVLAAHPNVVAPRIGVIVMPLKEVVALLPVRAAHLALGVPNRQPARLRASRVQTPAALTADYVQTPAVLFRINRSPRASGFRKCYPGLEWLHAVRLKTGSVPAALQSTVNLPSLASAYPRLTNYVSTAV